MPSVSRKQAKLMMIASHTKGGYGGVPQSVGKEFHTADEAQGALEAIAGGKPKRKITGAIAGAIHRAKLAKGY